VLTIKADLFSAVHA